MGGGTRWGPGGGGDPVGARWGPGGDPLGGSRVPRPFRGQGSDRGWKENKSYTKFKTMPGSE